MECNENWHILGKGKDIAKAGEVCECGKMQTTDTVGVMEPVLESEQS